ncbi:hypothetical protein NKDENANG_00294 [Candidatus Entotheonellaceae bacterium PAL068K]
MRHDEYGVRNVLLLPYLRIPKSAFRMTSPQPADVCGQKAQGLLSRHLIRQGLDFEGCLKRTADRHVDIRWSRIEPFVVDPEYLS